MVKKPVYPNLYSTLRGLTNPNLYLVLPGGCNARCPFCCFKTKQNSLSDDYLLKLKELLESLPLNFRQITVLGGEPSISPVLKEVLSVLSQRRKDVASKVVFTTNASGLILRKDNFPNNLTGYLKGVVDHVNISRHSSEDSTNLTIFGMKGKDISIPDRWQLRDIISRFNKMGIDVTLNCVLHNCHSEILRPTKIKGTYVNRAYGELYTTKGILHYLSFAKDVGASAVCFKKMESDSLAPTSTEQLFKSYKVLNSSKCPTCRTKTQLIAGIRVTWQAALEDKSSAIPQDLIFLPNGKLSFDWKKQWVGNFRDKKNYYREEENSTDDEGGGCMRGDGFSGRNC